MWVYQRVLSTHELGILQLTACHPIHPHNYINPCHEGFPSDWWMWDFNWSLATLSKLSKTLQDSLWKMMVWNIDGIVVTHCKSCSIKTCPQPLHCTLITLLCFQSWNMFVPLECTIFGVMVPGFFAGKNIKKRWERQKYWLELTRPNNFWYILGCPDAMFKGGLVWKLQICQIFVYQENIMLFFNL